MQKRTLLTLLYGLLTGAIFAQNDTTHLQRIRQVVPLLDKMYRAYAEKNHFPGSIYGLVVDGKLVHTQALGFANVASQTPVNEQSVFRIASMSKSFTAMAILQLRDAGKLRLDDPLARYIPAMQKQRYLSKDAPAITIRHLLTHAAGFPEDNPWGDRQLAVTPKELLAMLNKGISFSTTPGTGYEYSNLGFALLGLVIEYVSKQPYQAYIQQHIFQPLGMKNTYWEYSDVPKSSLALGYRWIDNQWVEQALLHDGAYGAMGGILTTVEDFGKYMAFHQTAWPANDAPEKAVLKRSSLREMQQPWQISSLNANYRYQTGRPCAMLSAYGYGLRYASDCQGRRMVGHSGGLPGFGSHWYILQDYGVGVVYFANQTYAPASVMNVQALDTLVALAQLQPKRSKPSAVLLQRQQQLVALLPNWQAAAQTGIFADNFFLDYFPEKLQAEAQAIYTQAGDIRKVHPIVPENNLRGEFIIEAKNGNIHINFTLSPENPALIQEYHIRLENRH